MDKSFERMKKSLLSQAFETRIPMSVLFELTARCNFNCKMCFVHDLDHKKALCEELSTQQWIKIFDDAIENGLMFATISGGECLLRSDFKELYLYLFKKGIHLKVYTNALLLNEEYLSFFKKYKPDLIQISLYGTSDEEYYLATGMRSYSVIQKNIDALAVSGIDYNISITLSEESKPFFKNIIDFVNEKKYSVCFSELYLAPREELKRNKLAITPKEICDFLVYHAKLQGKELQPVPFETLPEPGTGGENINEKHHCNAAKNQAHIDWHGIMHACVAIPSIGFDLAHYDYRTAWKLNCEAVDKLKFPKKCESCAYKRICNPCFAARCTKDLQTCNDSTCDLVRLKVSCGLRKLKI